MVGIDRRTGKLIDNFTSAVQSIEVIFSTRLASRVMRREFCGGAAELLGRLVTPKLFAIYQQLVATAIDLWEPRFHVRRIVPQGSVEEIRAGKLGILLELDYRPRGHLGDFTVERVVKLTLFARNNGLQVIV